MTLVPENVSRDLGFEKFEFLAKMYTQSMIIRKQRHVKVFVILFREKIFFFFTMLKKFCDGETQVNGEVAFSWSYPKVLKSPPREVQGYLSVRDDKWTQTIPQKTLGNQVNKFWKRVHAKAGERKIKSTGIHSVINPSSGEEIRKKFPNAKIERTRGHSFDDGAMIFSGRKVLPETRLRYKPEIRITSIVLPANSVDLCKPMVNDLNLKSWKGKKGGKKVR